MDEKQVSGEYGNLPIFSLQAIIMLILLLVCIYIVWHSFPDNSPLASQPDIVILDKTTRVKVSKASAITPLKSLQFDDGTQLASTNNKTSINESTSSQQFEVTEKSFLYKNNDDSDKFTNEHK